MHHVLYITIQPLKKETHLSHMHALHLRVSLLRHLGYDACPLSSTPASLTLTLTLALEHLQQPLDALVPDTQRLLLRVDSRLHLLHGLPKQEQLFGLPLVLRLQA